MHDGQRIDDTDEKTNALGIANSSARVLPTNTVCLSRTASVGYVAVMGRPMATSQDFVNWVCSKNLDHNFLKYLFIAEDVDLLRFASGSVHQTIYFPEVKAFHICHPPLAEQQRIVTVLDEAFAGLATAQARAVKNLQNSRALFESHLQSVFTPKGERWPEKPLAQLCEVFADGDWVESKDQSSDGIRLVQTGNIGKGVFRDRAEKARYISESTFKRLRCTEVVEGDCLIARLPDPVGRSCILPDTGKRMVTAVDCTIVRFHSEVCHPEFFNFYSQSTGYLSAIAKQCTGTTRSRISRSNLGLTPIPVPALAEQTRITAKLKAISVDTQHLESVYQKKLLALGNLRKSLLHHAFSGEL